MMAGFMSYFGGRRDTKQSSREAIVTLRQQLQMIDKKEDYLQKKVEEEIKKAKANAVSNKSVATQALKRKKAYEVELDRLNGTRFQLESQVMTLESASFNAETMLAMKKAAEVMGNIHRDMSIDKVDATMADIQDRMQVADEVAQAISASNFGPEIDDDELKKELEELEQDVLNDRLMGADHVPVHHPAGASRVEDSRQRNEEEEEEEELRKLQAALAME